MTIGLLGLSLGLSQYGGSSEPQPDGFDVFALWGQSNSVGLGTPIDGVLDAGDARIFQYGFTSNTVTLAAFPWAASTETVLSFKSEWCEMGMLPDHGHRRRHQMLTGALRAPAT